MPESLSAESYNGGHSLATPRAPQAGGGGQQEEEERQASELAPAKERGLTNLLVPENLPVKGRVSVQSVDLAREEKLQLRRHGSHVNLSVPRALRSLENRLDSTRLDAKSANK